MHFEMRTKMKVTYSKYIAIGLMIFAYAMIMVTNGSNVSLKYKLLQIFAALAALLFAILILSLLSYRKMVVTGDEIIYGSFFKKIHFEWKDIDRCLIYQKKTVRGVGETDILFLFVKKQKIKIVAAEYSGYSQLVQYLEKQKIRIEMQV